MNHEVFFLSVFLLCYYMVSVSTEICSKQQNQLNKKKYSFCCCRRLEFNRTSERNLLAVQVNSTYTNSTVHFGSYVSNTTAYNATYIHNETVIVPWFLNRTIVNSTSYSSINDTDVHGSIYEASTMACFAPNLTEISSVSFMDCRFNKIGWADVFIETDNITGCRETLTFNCTQTNDKRSCTFCKTSQFCVTLESPFCPYSNASFTGITCGNLSLPVHQPPTEEFVYHFEECHCSNDYEALIKHRTFSSYGFFCPKAKFYIGAFWDMSSYERKREAVQIALDTLNAHGHLFPAYEMAISNVDFTKPSRVERSTDTHRTGAGKLLNYLYHSNPRVLMLLGPQDNTLAKTVAAVAGLDRFNLMQIASETSDIALIGNRQSYPNFFRTNPSLYDINSARIEMIKTYNWKQIGLLYSSESFYVQINNQLKTRLSSSWIVGEESFATDPSKAIQSLKDKGAYVILASYDVKYSSKVFCEFHLLQMASPLYVILSLSNFGPQSTQKCTAHEVECARRDQFHFYSAWDNPQSPKYGLSYGRFIRLYKARTKRHHWNHNAVFLYDTVTVMADVIGRALPTLKLWKKNFDQIEYGDQVVANLFRGLLYSTDFYGITGRIRFNSDGSRYFPIHVYQYSDNRNRYVGIFNGWQGSFLSLANVHWLSGQTHRDVVEITKWRYISHGLFYGLCALGVIGALFAICLAIWLVMKRHYLIIRNSFNQLNVVIVIGAILLFVSLFSFGLDSSLVSNFSSICLIRKWLFCLGFILLVAPLTAKLWYGHQTYVNQTVMYDKKAKRQMWSIVGVLIFTTFVMLLFWTLLNPLERETKKIADGNELLCSTKVLDHNPFVREFIQLETCGCTKDLLGWFGLMVLYFALVLLVAIYFSLQSRQVFIYCVNDTWHCGWAVYIISASYAIGLILAIFLCDFPNWFFALIALLIMACVIAVLILLFMHKIIFLSSCCCCSRDSKSDKEDLIMYDSYFRKQNSVSPSTVISVCSKSTVDPYDINLNDSRTTLHHSGDTKKKQSPCKKCNWCCYGTPEFQNGGWTVNQEEAFILRGGKTNNNHLRLDSLIVTKTASSTQTEAWMSLKPKNEFDKVKDLNVDKGDGLKRERKNWTTVRVTLQRHGYLKSLNKKQVVVKKSPLKIFDQKPDWSHVVSHLSKEGIIGQRRPTKANLIPPSPDEIRNSTLTVGGSRRGSAFQSSSVSPGSRRRSTMKGTSSTLKRPIINDFKKKSPRPSQKAKKGSYVPGARIVNGPGSLPVPEQPSKLFIKKRKMHAPIIKVKPPNDRETKNI